MLPIYWTVLTLKVNIYHFIQFRGSIPSHLTKRTNIIHHPERATECSDHQIVPARMDHHIVGGYGWITIGPFGPVLIAAVDLGFGIRRGKIELV